MKKETPQAIKRQVKEFAETYSRILAENKAKGLEDLNDVEKEAIYADFNKKYGVNLSELIASDLPISDYLSNGKLPIRRILQKISGNKIKYRVLEFSNWESVSEGTVQVAYNDNPNGDAETAYDDYDWDKMNGKGLEAVSETYTAKYNFHIRVRIPKNILNQVFNSMSQFDALFKTMEMLYMRSFNKERQARMIQFLDKVNMDIEWDFSTNSETTPEERWQRLNAIVSELLTPSREHLQSIPTDSAGNTLSRAMEYQMNPKDLYILVDNKEYSGILNGLFLNTLNDKYGWEYLTKANFIPISFKKVFTADYMDTVDGTYTPSKNLLKELKYIIIDKKMYNQFENFELTATWGLGKGYDMFEFYSTYGEYQDKRHLIGIIYDTPAAPQVVEATTKIAENTTQAAAK